MDDIYVEGACKLPHGQNSSTESALWLEGLLEVGGTYRSRAVSAELYQTSSVMLKRLAVEKLYEASAILQKLSQVRKTLEFSQLKTSLEQKLLLALQEKNLNKTLLSYENLLELANSRSDAHCIQQSIAVALSFIRESTSAQCGAALEIQDTLSILQLADQLSKIGLLDVVQQVISRSISQYILSRYEAELCRATLFASTQVGVRMNVAPLHVLYESIHSVLLHIELRLENGSATTTQINELIFLDLFEAWSQVIDEALVEVERGVRERFFAQSKHTREDLSSLKCLDAAIEDTILVDRICKAQHSRFQKCLEKLPLHEVSLLSQLRKDCYELFPLLRKLADYYVLLEDRYLSSSALTFTNMQNLQEVNTSQTASTTLDDVFFVVSRSVRRSFAFVDPAVTSILLKNTSSTLMEFSKQYMDIFLRQTPESSARKFPELHQYDAYLHGNRKRSKRSDIDDLVIALAPINTVSIMSCRLQQLLNDTELLRSAIFPASAESDSISNTLKLIKSLSLELVHSCKDYVSNVSRCRLNLHGEVWEKLATTDYVISNEAYHMESIGTWVNDTLMFLLNDFCTASDVLTQENNELLIRFASESLSTRLENITKACLSFNHLGALRFERELRYLISGLSSATSLHLREHFSRLTQLSVLLSAETKSEADSYLTDMTHHTSWKLAENDVEKILSLRVDLA